MDTLNFMVRFLYRIRYKLFFGTALACLLAIYFSNFLPKNFVVTTTVFTGITSKPSLDDPSQSSADWNMANNAHDNIINLVRSKSTLQNISITLLAQHLLYGNKNADTKYISAEHYRNLVRMVPRDVIALLDSSSLEQTVKNFAAYRTEDRNNFIYAIFSWSDPYYSYLALSKIKIRRMQSSDMIEISYECNDAGVAVNTVALLNKELALRWEDLMLSTSNDVVKHFEQQLAEAKEILSITEDSLMRFNTAHKIINYEEQTKHLAALNNTFETRYEQILLTNRSANTLLTELESQMTTRVKLIRENETFLKTLSEISTLNGQIAEIEIFGGTSEQKNKTLEEYRAKLVDARNRISEITDRIDDFTQTQEGIKMTDMADRWLKALIDFEESRTQLEVMDDRRKEIDRQYETYSPVGPNLGRLDRSVKVAEESYLTILHHLGLAKLKQKNILLNSGALQIVTPPEFPLLSVPRKREFYVIAAFAGAIVFIIGFFLLLEMFDRTVRDKRRAERFTSSKVVGVMSANQKARFRGHNEEIRHIAASYMVNRLNKYITPGETMIVNLLSIDHGEGKTFVGEQLENCWKDMGFSVKYLTYEKDFKADSKRMLQIKSILELLPADEPRPDILLVEYDAIKHNTTPKQLLSEADVNLFVINARRAWRECDQPLFDNIKQLAREDSVLICLNKAERDAVEEVTGQLPPYGKLRNLVYKWFNFGITARDN